MVQSYGVDISSNNAHPINWTALFTFLKNLGGGAQPYVIIKATQGTGYINGDLKADIAAAKAAGFAVAAYLMDQGNDNVASEEALFKSVCEGLPQFDDDELPEGSSTATYIAHLKALDAQDPAAEDYLNQSEVAEGFSEGDGLWLAEYNDEPNVVSHPCEQHQYTDALTIPGCAGVFDGNVWLGTPARFAASFAYVTGTPAAVAVAPTPPPAPVVSLNAQGTPVQEDDGTMMIPVSVGPLDANGNGWINVTLPAGKTRLDCGAPVIDVAEPTLSGYVDKGATIEYAFETTNPVKCVLTGFPPNTGLITFRIPVA
jgi:hypothetical protein